jgi:hypothetical protein
MHSFSLSASEILILRSWYCISIFALHLYDGLFQLTFDRAMTRMVVVGLGLQKMLWHERVRVQVFTSMIRLKPLSSYVVPR